MVRVVEAVVEADHAGVFANGVGGHVGDLVGDAVDGALSRRIGIHDGRERRRCRSTWARNAAFGTKLIEGLAQALAQAFVVGVEEGLVLDDGAAEAGAELVQREGRERRAVERRARIQSVVAEA